MSKIYKVLIVDDHPVVRAGLAAVIARDSSLEVCGQAEDVDDAVALVRSTHPDIVILDLGLKTGHGLDLIKQIRAIDSDIKMLVASMLEESLYAERVLRAGAMGYVNKSEMLEKILEAVGQVLAGQTYLSPQMTHQLVQRSLGKEPDQAKSAIESLSDRELEVFRCVGRGLTTREIAEHLHLSVKTIETHRDNIKRKLNLHSGAELTRRAVQYDLETRNRADEV